MRRLALPDAAAVARAAADHVAGVVEATLRERPVCLLALSGGSTPEPLLAELARTPIDWSRVHLFQVDERVAPADSPERNLTALSQLLLAHVDLPGGQLHPMPVEGDDLQAAADRYAAVLERLAGRPPALDLVHLGLGEDGHTASLVPGDPVLEETRRSVAVTGPYGGHRRLTLTYPALNGARQRLWMVTGAAKAGAVAGLLAGDRALPAARVRGEASTLLLDRAAAARLDG